MIDVIGRSGPGSFRRSTSKISTMILTPKLLVLMMDVTKNFKTMRLHKQHMDQVHVADAQIPCPHDECSMARKSLKAQ
jgi:hypothetical protein